LKNAEIAVGAADPFPLKVKEDECSRICDETFKVLMEFGEIRLVLAINYLG
jgi:hypothetical protein